MRRAILAFFGTLAAGFALYAVAGRFHPVADPGRFGEVIGGLAVLFAIAAGWDEARRRALDRAKARAGMAGQARLSAGSQEPPGAGAGYARHPAAIGQVPHAEEASGCGRPTGAGERPIVFRPHRAPMLMVALLLGGLAVLYVLGLGIHHPARVFGTMELPGPLAVGIIVTGAAIYLGLFIRNSLPGKEIIVDTSGIVLPGRGRATWDQITEVKLCNTGYGDLLCTIRIGLNGMRRVKLAWWQTGCEPRKLYEAIQACFEEHQRRATPDHQGSTQRGSSLQPPIGVHQS